MYRDLTNIKEIKRILDQIVRESGNETEAFKDVQRLMNEGWLIYDCIACGDHLVWVLGKPRD